MNINEIKKKILEKFPVYRGSENEYIFEKIKKFDENLRKNLEEFLSNGRFSDYEVEGYTAKKLADEQNINPIGAFLALDWLKREPKKAKAELEKGLRRTIE